MSATYNWAYRPGVTNKYGFVINDSADDVRPSNATYVALYGNDETGNGSRQYPYRTISKGLTQAGTYVIAAAGVYREGFVFTPTVINLVGDGDVIVDHSFTNDIASLYIIPGLYGVTIRSSSNVTLAALLATNRDCRYSLYSTLSFRGVQKNSVFNGNNTAAFFLAAEDLDYGQPGLLSGNNTFLNWPDLPVSTSPLGGSGSYWNSIYVNCNISIHNLNSGFDYSLFYDCKFRCGLSGPFTAINDLPALLSFLQAVYPEIPGFTNCLFADPLFNNAATGDYTLAFNSPAKNAGDAGAYIGACPMAQPVLARGTESAGGFDFSSAVNLTVTDDSITLTDPLADAQIDTNVMVNSVGRELAGFSVLGTFADRNGQYLACSTDLAATVKNAGDTLLIPAPYLVETGALTYNGAVYQPGERFTTVPGQSTFSTNFNGVVREILEAPQRHTLLARFSDGGETVAAGTALTAGYYYYIFSGSVSYSGQIYTAGEVFKAAGTAAFSGTGTVITALSTESFQQYEYGVKPTSNNAGDSRTGVILRGNGDPAYLRGGLGVNEFPINAKFLQLRYMIKTHNLKP